MGMQLRLLLRDARLHQDDSPIFLAQTPTAKTMQNTDGRNLNQFRIFRGLSTAQHELIDPFLLLRQFAPGALVLQQSQSNTGLFLLIDGSVKVVLSHSCQSGDTSHEVIISISGPGEVLGEIDMADGEGHTLSVVTLQECSFLWLATEDFWRLSETVPQLGRNLSRTLAARLRQATTVQGAVSSLNLSARVAFYLLLLADSCGIGQDDDSVLLPIRLKQSEVAALVGSSREYVNRVFGSFRDSRYIDIGPDNHITIRNICALRHYCEGLAGRPQPAPSEKQLTNRSQQVNAA